MPKIDDLMPLGQDPNLIGAIQRDVALAGLVGEEDAGLLVYLAYSSRRLKKPISIIVKGPSGSGKDEIQRRPADLMPLNDVRDFMSITPQALFYHELGWLEKKVLLSGERSHQTDAAQRDRTKAIRELLSNGYVTKSTVMEGCGVDICQNGPVSYSETTTQSSVFDEDGTRCFQVDADASQEQTRRVLIAQASTYMPGAVDSTNARNYAVSRHREFQDSLEDVKVVIPYADALSRVMPSNLPKARRAFRLVLSLVEVLAFVHQHQREQNAAGQIEATATDYEVARRLVLGPLRVALGSAGDLAKMKTVWVKLPAGVFDTGQAASAVGSSSHKTILNTLRKLVAADALECVDPGGGKVPATWSKTGRPPSESILPCVSAFPNVSKW